MKIMSTFRIKSTLALVVLSLVFSCKEKTEKSQPPENEKLNIVYIAVDDMNRWIAPMGGQAITPSLDKLAAQGMLFTNAQCVVPACNPSRVAIMTGLRPETTGQFVNAGNFREKQVTPTD